MKNCTTTVRLQCNIFNARSNGLFEFQPINEFNLSNDVVLHLNSHRGLEQQIQTVKRRSQEENFYLNYKT